MALKIIERPSPNHDARSARTTIDILVLHYTGMKTAEAALTRLCDPASKVSAHYTIDRDGCVYSHVPEDRRAWHAGVSYWAGERNVNARSIGIELVNPGHEFGYELFPDEQVEALIELSKDILSRHPIPPHRVLGHSDIAPARKIDPGELFPWDWLAEEGVGLWPAAHALGEPLEIALAHFGYGFHPRADVVLEDAVTAFQRHFRPSRIDGTWDGECARLLGGLLAEMHQAL